MNLIPLPAFNDNNFWRPATTPSQAQCHSSHPSHGAWVYGAHGYTLANLKFANIVEPDNTNPVNYTAHCQTLRAVNLPNLPSTVGLERQINPFSRSPERSIRQSIQAYAAHNSTLDDAQAFAILREWKNQF